MSVPMMPSAPAEQARATEDDCGDAVEVLGGLARVRIAELGTGDEEQRRDPRREPGQRVDAEQDAVRVDAGPTRGFRVVADGVDMTPPGGLRQREPCDRIQHEHEDDAR